MDTLGLIWAVVVHPGDLQDREGAKLVLAQARGLAHLARIWADSGYRGEFVAWVQARYAWLVEIVAKPATGFAVLPHRWIVERTFAWFGRFRRLSKDYKFHPATSETMLMLAMISIMLRRLAPGRAY